MKEESDDGFVNPCKNSAFTKNRLFFLCKKRGADAMQGVYENFTTMIDRAAAILGLERTQYEFA